MITRVHAKRPPPAPQAISQVRRLHHPSSAPVPRPPAPMRKGPVARPPPRPYPPPRGSSKLLQCLHIHFHPSQKRDAARLPPRSSKHIGSKYISSQQVPPFPPPRGAVRPPRRHVHWAPAQAPLPHQPYPYPSHASSSTTSRATSHSRAMHYPLPMAIPRYQPPRSGSGSTQPPHRRK
ncbi:hypothetical protein J3R83DRAFT_8283 [Lanmaoa asiatica]|nr:hypothetical protein J3R83DRAFT_8283 [Lanmaoa asiatica]